MEKNSIQHFDWGHIEWIYEPESGNSLSSMNIALTTILPHKRQERHIHYGNEQVIYVLSGKGIQHIGEGLSDIEPGSVYHIDAGSAHETINEGDESIRELIISMPVLHEQNLLMPRGGPEALWEIDADTEKVEITNEIMYIYEAIVAPMRIPVAIFDNQGSVVIKGRDYPEFCKTRCSSQANEVICPVYEIKGEYGPPHYNDLSAYICPYGLTVFLVPITLAGKPIGIIKAGHIRTPSSSLSDSHNSADEASVNSSDIMPLVPKGTLKAVMQQLKKLSKSVENYYVFKKTEVELSKKEERIQDIAKHEVALEESLKSTREQVLNIQINNHFLFNTLNAIAGMAIKEHSLKTYQSIIDLAKMLRYTASSQNYFVQIKTEMQYLHNYINLQMLRYGDRLEVDFDISEEIKNKNMPYNCLQPMVENCFIHGFKNTKDNMRISISGIIKEGNITIEVRDNGEGMSEEVLSSLRQRINEFERHELRGLAMVYSKLKLIYEDSFDFAVESMQGCGTTVRIVLPDHIA